MTALMIDLETLGREPGCVILSIGACAFTYDDSDPVGDTFYVEIDIDSCTAAGLHVDDETRAWWEEKDQSLAPLDGETALPDALDAFRSFATTINPKTVWAKSPAFDCMILQAAFDAADMGDVPWAFYDERDVRTTLQSPLAVDREQQGPAHHALADATHQAREVAATRVREQRAADTLDSDGDDTDVPSP